MAMSPDQTADLWLKIDQLHLNYLKSEENTNKLEIRKKLEGEYIIIVWKNRQILHDSTYYGKTQRLSILVASFLQYLITYETARLC